MAIGGVNFEEKKTEEIAKNSYNNLQKKKRIRAEKSETRTRIICKLLKYISSQIITFVRLVEVVVNVSFMCTFPPFFFLLVFLRKWLKRKKRKKKRKRRSNVPGCNWERWWKTEEKKGKTWDPLPHQCCFVVEHHVIENLYATFCFFRVRQ